MDFNEILKNFLLIATLTVGVTQVYKEVVSDLHTQKVSVIIAIILALVTGTSLLLPLGFVPATNFVDLMPQFGIIYIILFYIADLGVTGFIASKGSNYVVDLFNKKTEVQYVLKENN